MNHQTLDKLHALRLKAMAQTHHKHMDTPGQSTYTNDEYLALLTDSEWEARQHNKTQRLLKQAHFKQHATLDDIDYHSNRQLDKNSFLRLTSLDFIAKSQNIIFTGASGVGKSYLAQAIGHQACQQHYKVRYTNSSRLFNKLKLSKVDGTYLKELKSLANQDLLILDDFGLQALDNMAREALLDIIDDRHQKKATIVASQIPVSQWYDLIGENTIADAILDRLIHAAHRINLKGESLRKINAQNLNLNDQ